MTTFHILGNGDSNMQALKDNLSTALSEFPLSGKVEEMPDYKRGGAFKSTAMPAIIVDGEVLSEGVVPSVEELKRILRNRQLLRSKLYRVRRILVPVDLSSASENALTYACIMAHAFDASVEVVYAMDSIFEGNRPSPSGFLSGYKKTMQEELDNFVRGVLANIKDSGACTSPVFFANEHSSDAPAPSQSLRTRIVFGFPEEVLSTLTANADLLIMGTTGRGNITRKLFGSVSIAVSKTAHCPVLLVPSMAKYKGFNNILYASNFESLDALAIKQTVTFSRRFKGQLHFVHVGPPSEKGVDMEKKLFEINYIYADPEMPFIFHKVVGEDIVESLHEYAFMQRIDLFIFVTHQRTFWENILHHSISKEMLLHASAPVLVIHAENDTLE